MFNLQQFNEERGALFDEAFPHKIAQVRRGDGHALQGYYNIPIKSFLTESHTLLLKRFLEELEKEIGGEFERQSLGNKWNLATGEMEPYWGQSEEAVEYYNSCLENVKDIINKHKSLIDTL